MSSLKQYPALSDYAQRTARALHDEKDPLPRTAAKQLSVAHQQTRDTRQRVEVLERRAGEAKAAFEETKVSLKLLVEASLKIGAALKLERVMNYSTERSDDPATAEFLEDLLRAHGELGAQLSRHLNSCGNDYARASNELSMAQAELEKARSTFTADLLNLQAAVYTGRAVLQQRGAPIPRIPRPGKKGNGAKQAVAESAGEGGKPGLHVVTSAAAPAGTDPVSEEAPPTAPVTG